VRAAAVLTDPVFYFWFGFVYGSLGLLGLSPGPKQPRPLKDMVRHPLRYRIRFAEVKGTYVSELALAAPYMYLIGVGSAAIGILLTIYRLVEMAADGLF
jgi:hypothetical protein